MSLSWRGYGDCAVIWPLPARTRASLDCPLGVMRGDWVGLNPPLFLGHETNALILGSAWALIAVVIAWVGLPNV